MRPSIGLPTLILSISATTFMLAGCGKSQPGPEPMPPADTAQADAAAQLSAAKAAEEAKAAELAAKEQELAARESELKVKELEAELAKRDAETAAAAAAAAAKAASAKKTPAKTSTSTAPKTAATTSPIVVPAGTQLAIELTTPLTTKTNLVGDQVQGRLASDLVVDGRRAAKAGATVTGSVTKVVSGSKHVGGTPTLGPDLRHPGRGERVHGLHQCALLAAGQERDGQGHRQDRRRRRRGRDHRPPDRRRQRLRDRRHPGRRGRHCGGPQDRRRSDARGGPGGHRRNRIVVHSEALSR